MLNNNISTMLRHTISRYQLSYRQIRQVYRAVYCNQEMLRGFAMHQLNKYIQELVL